MYWTCKSLPHLRGGHPYLKKTKKKHIRAPFCPTASSWCPPSMPLNQLESPTDEKETKLLKVSLIGQRTHAWASSASNNRAAVLNQLFHAKLAARHKICKMISCGDIVMSQSHAFCGRANICWTFLLYRPFTCTNTYIKHWMYEQKKTDKWKINWVNKLTLKDNTFSYCFTLFICGGPCHLFQLQSYFPLRTTYRIFLSLHHYLINIVNI